MILFTKAQDAVNKLSGPVLILLAVVIFLCICGLTFLLYLSVRKTRREEIAKQNDSDDMTNVNKSQLISIMNTFITRYRFDNEMSLFLFEFDEGKSLRDAFGDKQYERIIKTVMNRVKDLSPKNSVICNTNVDQYAILLRGKIPTGRLEQFADALVNSIQNPIALASTDDGKISVDVSLGVAIYPSCGTNAKDILNNAEMALYINKKDSVNKYCFYSTRNVDKAEEGNINYYRQIKDAMRNKEFTLVYQPIIDTKGNKIKGFEALIRWVHPTLGVLPPNKFLNIMEHTGDIIWVGKWEIDVVCSQYNAWRKAANIGEDIMISFNLSPKQLLDPQIAVDFQAICKRYHINPKHVCLEIVEFAMFEKYSIISDNIQKLHNVGFTIAIDDFGLDVNSLSRISSLPIDIIKFERDFVSKADDNYMMTKVVNMLVEFAKDNNKEIVAEGVENLEVLDKVEEFGIFLMQGYLFMKPSSPLQIEQYAANEEWKVNFKDESTRQKQEAMANESKEEADLANAKSVIDTQQENPTEEEASDKKGKRKSKKDKAEDKKEESIESKAEETPVEEARAVEEEKTAEESNTESAENTDLEPSEAVNEANDETTSVEENKAEKAE